MKKAVLVVSFVLLIIGILSFSSLIGSSAESMYIRKIVSVVYDDSGSMSDANKYVYANYAMQTFCGMLNNEDKLFITYMNEAIAVNDYQPTSIDLSSSGIQQSVNTIRDHKDLFGSTPFEAVEIAFDKLKKVQDSNANTQYWLVVITDGDFDKHHGAGAQAFLSNQFKEYAEATMPNGANPQITFLAIGDDATAPEENKDLGIFTYFAKNSEEIVSAMSSLADKISGRTRLSTLDLKQIDDNTIQATSTIPLLNIAVFSQNSDSKIITVECGNDFYIPITRFASMRSVKLPDLYGNSVLLGDSKTIIPPALYTLKFDKTVNLDDVVVLFEPALEVRLAMTLNGNPIRSISDLSDAQENDELSISGGIYEMGTDNLIDPALLPPGTTFEISVKEEGKEVCRDSGLTLENVILHNCSTEVAATVKIEGFNPIGYSARFTPLEYKPRVNYSIIAEFNNGIKSIRYDDLAGNSLFSVIFSFLADGEEITDINSVKALNPALTVSPDGNGGKTEYTSDGKIVFIPDMGNPAPSNNPGSYDVSISCEINDGTRIDEFYTVLWAEYKVYSENASESIKKTELFNNQIGAIFYIEKDGNRLAKADAEKRLTAILDDAHKDLKTLIEVADDGTIKVIPFTDKEQKLTFGTWFINWYRYWNLSGKDIEITLITGYGSANGKIDVCEESFVTYILPYVIAPFLLELIAIVVVLLYVLCYIFKPWFDKSTVLYVGRVKRRGSPGQYYHEISEFDCYPLRDYNHFKYRYKFTFKPEVVYEFIDNLGVSATSQGGITLYGKFCFKGAVYPLRGLNDPVNPTNLYNSFSQPPYIDKYNIQYLSQATVTNDRKSEISELTLDNPTGSIFYVYVEDENDNDNAIVNGVIFAYAYDEN